LKSDKRREVTEGGLGAFLSTPPVPALKVVASFLCAPKVFLTQRFSGMLHWKHR
jgi:hypothetical protein